LSSSVWGTATTYCWYHSSINRRRLDADADADAAPAAISATGWHEYFTTTHAMGAAGTLQQHLAELAALPRT